jgi:hypothetical protein
MWERITDHLDFHECLGAIIEQITRFSAIDADDPEEELATEAKGHWAASNLGANNNGDVIANPVLQDLVLGELLFEVGSKPDAGEGP